MSKQYYSPKNINAKKALYNVIFGERSNGKTYALLKQAVETFAKDRSQFAYLRRWKEDVSGQRGSRIFEGLNANGEVAKITKGEYSGVHYYSRKFYLCNYDDTGKAIYNEKDLLGFCFALSECEHNKATSYPHVKTIVFDEFLTNGYYLADEFTAFANTLSTLIRDREDVIIYMLGNTVNKFAPYFEEMGLKNIAKMQQGTIDIYHYGDSKLTVAVEYCASTASTKKSNKYFAFDNPKLEMITGGAWELSLYPHLPCKYKPKNILLTYFIEYSGHIYQCEIIEVNGICFTYIHIKTSEIKDKDSTIIYTLDYNAGMNYNRSILKPTNNIQKRILWFFSTDRVYYQNNTVGDAISNYLKTCKRGL